MGGCGNFTFGAYSFYLTLFLSFKRLYTHIFPEDSISLIVLLKCGEQALVKCVCVCMDSSINRHSRSRKKWEKERRAGCEAKRWHQNENSLMGHWPTYLDQELIPPSIHSPSCLAVMNSNRKKRSSEVIPVRQQYKVQRSVCVHVHAHMHVHVHVCACMCVRERKRDWWHQKINVLGQ